jgi:hypothetical protein
MYGSGKGVKLYDQSPDVPQIFSKFKDIEYLVLR